MSLGPDVESRRIWVAARQPAIGHHRVAVDVGGFVRRQEQGRMGALDRLAAALQRIEVAYAVGLAGPARQLIDRLRHARLDQARTDRVDADAGPGELLRRI